MQILLYVCKSIFAKPTHDQNGQKKKKKKKKKRLAVFMPKRTVILNTYSSFGFRQYFLSARDFDKMAQSQLPPTDMQV